MAEPDEAHITIAGDKPEPAHLTALAAGLLETYRRRACAFGGDLFQAPAWDVLLYLQCSEFPLHESHLQQATNTRPETLRRWMSVLVQEQLVHVSHNSGQRVYRLTQAGSIGLAKSLLPGAFAQTSP